MRTDTWPDDWPLRLIQLLAVPGLVVAFYLLLYHNGNLVEVCTASGWDDCGKVSGPDAPYSAIGPLPVALIGLLGYAALFLLIWLKDWIPVLEDNIPELIVGLTSLALIFSLGLTAIELFVVQAICRFCVVSALIVTIMFFLAVGNLRMSRSTETMYSDRRMLNG
jgi:uncharacterized membrane protein